MSRDAQYTGFTKKTGGIVVQNNRGYGYAVVRARSYKSIENDKIGSVRSSRMPRTD